MSLEAKIEALTVAVEALTARINGAEVNASSDKPGKPTKSAPKSAPVATPAATSPTQTTATQPVADTQAAKTPTMEDARKVVLDYGAKKGRDALVSLLGKFGASKLPEVQPHLYAKLIADATEELKAAA